MQTYEINVAARIQFLRITFMVLPPAGRYRAAAATSVHSCSLSSFDGCGHNDSTLSKEREPTHLSENNQHNHSFAPTPTLTPPNVTGLLCPSQAKGKKAVSKPIGGGGIMEPLLWGNWANLSCTTALLNQYLLQYSCMQTPGITLPLLPWPLRPGRDGSGWVAGLPTLPYSRERASAPPGCLLLLDVEVWAGATDSR